MIIKKLWQWQVKIMASVESTVKYSKVQQNTVSVTSVTSATSMECVDQ